MQRREERKQQAGDREHGQRRLHVVEQTAVRVAGAVSGMREVQPHAPETLLPLHTQVLAPAIFVVVPHA